jgi:solute carrier family 25 (peroxisomal adenine nucleotide transporter), member 17
MAKVRIQARSANSVIAAEEHSSPPPSNAPHHKAAGHHDGALDILRRVLREEGPLGWYQVRSLDHPHALKLSLIVKQGMGAQILKAVLSQGVLFMSKDQFERWAILVIAALYRIKRS